MKYLLPAMDQIANRDLYEEKIACSEFQGSEKTI
jgi:hypothetical protein